jgi:phage terminase small subunit
MSEDLKNKPQLTVKQQKFVAAHSQGMSAKDAVVAAGYNVTTEKSAQSLGSIMLANPKIQNALAAAIQEEFPNVPQLAARRLVNVLIDDTTRPGEVLKAIEVLSKICGWQAPSQHASVNVTLRDKFKLPEE